jgi:vWA-MoxR associated protein C-terminal domain
MTQIYGFIVGIEKYDQPKWDIPGPCKNALRMVDWLLSINTPPGNINLFVDPIANASSEIDTLTSKGVSVTTSGSWEPIDSFSREELPGKRPAGSNLFVYWCGHGFVQPDGTRIFICRDYTAGAKRNRIFNATTFLRNLKLGSRFQGFREQIVLADVCGTQSHYLGLNFEPTNMTLEDLGQIANQIAFFATPEGEYAREDDGEGVFTRIARQVLIGGASWPKIEQFKQQLLSALDEAGASPFWIEAEGNKFAMGRRLFGYEPHNPGTILAQSVVRVLSAVSIPDSAFRPHYLRTVNHLGEPELAKAEGLAQMIDELASLQDASRGRVPYGLLEFLVRLSGAAELRDPVERWLADNALEQKNDLANIREQITTESKVKILLIEVENDEHGMIASFQSFLRTNDLSRAVGPALPWEAVESWSHFSDRIGKLIRDLLQDASISDFEIHFLADPPLFDKAFHQIPLLEGGTLGEEFVVILRHRERIRCSRPTIVEPWRVYAAALRRIKPRKLKLYSVSDGGCLDRVLERDGLCYTEFDEPRGGASLPGPTNQTQLLLKLLRLGVPYLYLLLWDQNETGRGKALEKELRSWLVELASLDRLPGALRQRRALGSKFASEGTLLWDDPEFIPFFTSTEVSINGK